MNTASGATPHNRTRSHQKQVSNVIATGFALFAMFFGAGNMVFPLFIGANAGHDILLAALAFVIVGVGTPLLGLIATSLYQGDYESFFGRLGKAPGFIIITFLMLIIGPLSAAPRTEVITYQSLLPFLPWPLSNSVLFSLLFCVITFLAAYRETKIVEIIGTRITPVKLFCFILLILMSIVFETHHQTTLPAKDGVVMQSVSMGYGTMDMLGAFFFSTIACRTIAATLTESQKRDGRSLTKYLLISCLIAGILLGLIYLGFMISAYYQSAGLHGHSPDQLLELIATAVLGSYGAIFVGFCVLFACLATSIALADVTSTYLFHQVVKEKIPRIACMIFVIFLMFCMTQLGFDGIMKFSYPILEVLYPTLIMMCFLNILYKLCGFKWLYTPLFLTAGVAAYLNFLR